jgi:CRP/FNR family transcriptional regulator, cyclic AMP receptor protein
VAKASPLFSSELPDMEGHTFAFAEELSTLRPRERAAVIEAPWFSEFSPVLRHDVLRQALVRRYEEGSLIARQGTTPEAWMCCCAGSVRIGTLSEAGRQMTLAYLEPGTWFGESSLIAGGVRTHDAYARGNTSVLCVPAAHFAWLLEEHKEFSVALLRLHAKRVRRLYEQLDDVRSLPLRSRVAKQLVQLAKAYGIADPDSEHDVRITLKLIQEELAQLVGSSRQRLNCELKILERQHAILPNSRGLVVRPETLSRILAARL